ncbi:MAG: hypothetical protein HGB37_01315 [Candidatus Moranbacteria bacterium]|nr:hypothetical protein [Candidatus Moranbacteria bacterium]
MTQNDLISLVQEIVKDAVRLKDAYTDLRDVTVGYACVFAHGDAEYAELRKAAESMGQEIKSTPTGSVFLVQPMPTVAGSLRVLKIRIPDETRTERGDADFNVPDYQKFRIAVMGTPGFTIIPRADCEMIELMESGADVRVYFSDPPVEKQLGLATLE